MILIDGGKGQLAQAKNVFAELDVSWDKNHPLLLGVAKGADRKAGLERCSLSRKVRDSVCRQILPRCMLSSIFAMNHMITRLAGTVKTGEGQNTSSLETIEGVGPKRRQMLLKYMGGLQGLRNASVEEIAKVPGISQGLAEKDLLLVETLGPL